MLRIWSHVCVHVAPSNSHRYRAPPDGGSMRHQSLVARPLNVPNPKTIAIEDHAKRVKGVRREAFGWYSDAPPSPMEAAVHFAQRAEGDSANRSLYAEALGLFLATCWNIHPYQQRVA